MPTKRKAPLTSPSNTCISVFTLNLGKNKNSEACQSKLLYHKYSSHWRKKKINSAQQINQSYLIIAFQQHKESCQILHESLSLKKKKGIKLYIATNHTYLVNLKMYYKLLAETDSRKLYFYSVHTS